MKTLVSCKFFTFIIISSSSSSSSSLHWLKLYFGHQCWVLEWILFVQAVLVCAEDLELQTAKEGMNCFKFRKPEGGGTPACNIGLYVMNRVWGVTISSLW